MFIKYTNLFFNYTGTCAPWVGCFVCVYVFVIVLSTNTTMMTAATTKKILFNSFIPCYKCLHALHEIETTLFDVVILFYQVPSSQNQATYFDIEIFCIYLFWHVSVFAFSFKRTEIIISNLLPAK